MAKETPQVFVKPAPGCMVRDNLTRVPLKDDGEWKPKTKYWDRRIRMIDVIECEPPKAVAPRAETHVVEDVAAPSVENEKKTGRNKAGKGESK
jgi:hypothetical protein